MNISEHSFLISSYKSNIQIFGPTLRRDIVAEDFSIVVNDQTIEINEEAKNL